MGSRNPIASRTFPYLFYVILHAVLAPCTCNHCWLLLLQPAPTTNPTRHTRMHTHAHTCTHTHTHQYPHIHINNHISKRTKPPSILRPMFERNYAADNFLTVYFGVRYPDWVNHSSTLKAQLYLAIVAQGLVVKSDISTRRARNSFGIITWQHNEIWSVQYASQLYIKIHSIIFRSNTYRLCVAPLPLPPPLTIPSVESIPPVPSRIDTSADLLFQFSDNNCAIQF